MSNIMIAMLGVVFMMFGLIDLSQTGGHQTSLIFYWGVLGVLLGAIEGKR